MNDTSDPYYTGVQAGAYDSRRPKGQPCDASTSCDSNAPPRLPVVGQIVVGVVVGTVGLFVVGLFVTWVAMSIRQGKKA
jgi:endoglucanase